MSRVLIRHDTAMPSRLVAGKFLDGVTPQPLVGALVTIAALLGIAITWRLDQAPPLHGSDGVVLASLTVAVTLSRVWPLRIGQVIRVYLAGVPLYLLCCLLSPPFAALGVGIGMLAGELAICRSCGNTIGDIGSQVGRWVLVGLAVSLLVHVPAVEASVFAGVLAGACLWAGDILTAPLVFSPITGKSTLMTLREVAQRSWPADPMEYIIGLLALLLFQSNLPAQGLTWIDAPAILVVILPVVLLYVYLKGEDDLKHSM